MNARPVADVVRSNSDSYPGLIAICACGWTGRFRPTDNEHEDHDRVHAIATAEGDEHAREHRYNTGEST